MHLNFVYIRNKACSSNLKGPTYSFYRVLINNYTHLTTVQTIIYAYYIHKYKKGKKNCTLQIASSF